MVDKSMRRRNDHVHWRPPTMQDKTRQNECCRKKKRGGGDLVGVDLFFLSRIASTETKPGTMAPGVDDRRVIKYKAKRHSVPAS